MKRYIAMAALAAMFIPFGCEQLSIDEPSEKAPVIETFSPMSAPAGSEVIVEGLYLNNVTKAFIGDVEVEIIEKVSNTRLSIEVGQTVTGGRIRLENPYGEGESAEDFTSSFAVPAIISSLVPESAELGEQVLLTGENLNSAVRVLFFSDEEETGHEADIISRSDREVVVEVPYVPGDDARIRMEYYSEGGVLSVTSADTAPVMEVIKYTPVIDFGYEFTRTAVGTSISISGQYLNNINRVTVRRADPQEGESGEEFDAIFRAESESLSFTVPAGDFPDGETATLVTFYWFDSNEESEFDNQLVVYVPFVYMWQNITTDCQTMNEDGMYSAFFSPQTGQVYANADWATKLDPVAMKYNGTQYETNNVFKEGTVTEEEYNSVIPYFFFSAVSSGKELQINSPANSNSQLKNFGVSYPVTSQNRVPGTNSSTASGTPILTFRFLTSDNATEAALIEKVRNGEIENINEELFPIDATKETVAGISYSSASGGLKQSSNPGWGITTPSITTGSQSMDTDLVFLMAYYDFNGYNAENRVENIRRIGILHLKNINWTISNNDFRGTQVTFDCYWQKYDYDYSKLQ